MVKITADAEPDLRARFERGETCIQIATAYRCSDSTISKRLRDMGVTVGHGNRIKLEVEEAIKAGWMAGESATQIGRKLGMTRNAVIGIAHRRGWQRAEEVIAVNRRVESRRARAAPVAKPQRRPPTPKAALESVSRIGIAGNGALFEKAPGAKMPSLRAVTSTGVPARICDDHFTRRGCKWPIGTPPAGFADEQLFCNGARAEDEARYCPEHLALAFSATQPKRKTNPPPLGGGQGYRYGERRFG